MTIDEQLTVDLWLLDAVLTGKDSRSGRGNEDKIVSMDKFTHGELFYLSDGGYSRVFYFPQNEKLILTANSRQEVKDKWETIAAQTIRRRIERRINAAH